MRSLLKIKKLEIFNSSEATSVPVQSIDFNIKGVSVIFGDVTKPKESKKTSNSLGKTLLLHMIDFMFGANYSSFFAVPELSSIVLKATLFFDGNELIVKRFLLKEKSKIIELDGREITLDEYKAKLNIDRSLYGQQVNFEEKVSLVKSGGKGQPSLNDYRSFLNLLDLKNVSNYVENIYNSQNDLKATNKLISLSSGGQKNKKKDFKNQAFILGMEREELEQKLSVEKNKLSQLSLSDDIKETGFQYKKDFARLQNIQNLVSYYKLTNQSFDSFISESNKSSLSLDDVKKYYKAANFEIPELLKKKLADVEAFYKSVFQDQRTRIEEEKRNNEEKIRSLKKELVNLSSELDLLGKKMSQKDAYQNSLKISEEYSTKLQRISFEEGKLDKLVRLENKVDELKININNSFDNAKKAVKSSNGKISDFMNFIYKKIKYLYGDDVSGSFNIGIKDANSVARPLELAMDITGDGGEGINEAKKILIDLLIFNFNNEVDLLIEDSSVFNGIDPRQLFNILKIIDEIAFKKNKQAILTINKYQLDDPGLNWLSTTNSATDKNQKVKLTLSENVNLLGFKY